eukprot:Nk52_evm82s62 gene=Nk52_evmTU82s62
MSTSAIFSKAGSVLSHSRPLSVAAGQQTSYVTSYINGSYLAQNSSRKTFDTINPATGNKIATVQEVDQSDLDHAVEAAHQGFRQWSSMSPVGRSRIMRRAVDIMRDPARLREIALKEVEDNGKPLTEALAVDVNSGADCIEYYAGLCDKIKGEFFSGITNGAEDSRNSSFCFTMKEPLGVCGGIGAWNYPFQIACWKSAPALAAGNAMIFKPSEYTPLTAAMLAEIYTEAGVPNGVFNVVQGTGPVGGYISSHPNIQKVSFTGSVPTGKKVMGSASETLKGCTLELGGKSPLIIFPDCDWETAINSALMANFYTQGEICTNGTRVFVHKDIHDKFVSELVARTQKICVGDPMKEESTMGAIIHEPHLNSILDYVKKAKAEGGNIVCGGNRFYPQDGEAKNGFYMEPTIITNCNDSMTNVREEIFGPVMSVLSFSDEKEVIERANNTHFGLAAGLITKDLKRAYEVSSKLESGIVWINNYGLSPINVPFGGYKMSGIGKENGEDALQHYLKTKTVYVEQEKAESVF